MVEWKVIENAARGFLTTKNLAEAEKAIASGLKSFPNQINLLVVASDVYRASINHEKSLEHAKLLVKYYPHQPNGYIRSAQDLVALGEKLEAQKIIQDGIKVISGNLYLLLVARDIFGRSGNREKCLKYSQDLIIYHPNDWRGYGRAAQDLIALDQFKEAQKQIQTGLAKIPNQIDILTIATKVYRASGDHEKSLEYSELLITHHPDNWDGYGLAAQDLIALEQFEEAQKQIQTGLAKIPNQIDLLTIATDIYRASGDREKSLEYSELLITHHPGNWNGYRRAAQDLVALKRFEQAQEKIQAGLEKIQAGLEKIPNQVNLLVTATDVYRASGDREKSLEYSELLITQHPDKWQGYGLAAQDLVALKQFEKAQAKVQAGLEKLPNQLNLLTIATDVFRKSGDREKSLEYSELLITHHPDKWNGYGLAAQEQNALTRFDKTYAQEKIQTGLEKIPNQINLLTIATYVFRKSGDREKSLEYSELLITHHPDKWQGYGLAAQDLVALKRFDQALVKIQAGLEKIPNQINLLTIATDLYRASGDRKKSLEHSKLLITHHPDKLQGYMPAIHEAIISQNFDEAKSIAKKGISKMSNEKYFFATLSDIAFAQGDKKMHESYEKKLAKMIFSEDIFKRLEITPETIKSQLKVEYASTTQHQSCPKAIKPDLYIIAGCSGCGKTTILNTNFFSIDRMFSAKETRIKIQPLEIIEFLAKRRLATSSINQSMLCSNAFAGIWDMRFLCEQDVLPKQTLLHLDLTNFFLLPQLKELVGIDCLKLSDLESVNVIKQHIADFFAIPFFKKFNSLSIATINADFDINSKRWNAREGKRFYFDPEMRSIYNEIVPTWCEQISLLPTSTNNLITEMDGHYLIRPTKLNDH